MKKLGLIGGLGPESTMMYYRDIVYGVKKRLGREAFPNLTVESLDVFRVLEMCGAQDYEALAAYLGGAVEQLAAAGADFAAISANTPHIVFDDVAAHAPVPMVSIIDAARDEALRRGYARVGLLGTAFTMEGAFFREPFERAGVSVAVPTEAERAFVARRISGELEQGVVRRETTEAFMRIIERMAREDGIEAVVLGCTELPLLFSQTPPPIACLDTVQLHVQALVDRILED